MNLTKIRKANNLTQVYVAKFLDVTQANYSFYETGQRQPPIELLPKLAEVLNCSIEQVVFALIQAKQNATNK